MSEAPEVVASRRAYDGKLLKIDRETVRLPGGALAELETIRHPGAAAAVPFAGEDTVILIRQYRHAAGASLIEVPAGKLDAGERPEQCVARELAEEIGHEAQRIVPLGSILTTPGFTDEVIWLFEAHDLSPCSARPEEDEVIEPVRVRFVDAIEMVRRGEIRDAKSVAALFHAAARRGLL